MGDDVDGDEAGQDGATGAVELLRGGPRAAEAVVQPHLYVYNPGGCRSPGLAIAVESLLESTPHE